MSMARRIAETILWRYRDWVADSGRDQLGRGKRESCACYFTAPKMGISAAGVEPVGYLGMSPAYFRQGITPMHLK
jgi:hypothetical protein